MFPCPGGRGDGTGAGGEVAGMRMMTALLASSTIGPVASRCVDRLMALPPRARDRKLGGFSVNCREQLLRPRNPCSSSCDMLVEALHRIRRSAIENAVDLAAEAAHPLEFGLELPGGLMLITRRLRRRWRRGDVMLLWGGCCAGKAVARQRDGMRQPVKRPCGYCRRYSSKSAALLVCAMLCQNTVSASSAGCAGTGGLYSPSSVREDEDPLMANGPQGC